MSSSKLRLGKGNTRSRSLTEKQQIELAIALSLQQQQVLLQEQEQHTECPRAQDQHLRNVEPCHPLEAPPCHSHDCQDPVSQEPRTRRAAVRKKIVSEDSDDDDSQAPSSNGADDYEPEPSSSDSDGGSDSNFAEEDTDDERPRKKKKAEKTTAKKALSKPPIGRKKAGARSKAPAGAGLRDDNPPGAIQPAAPRSRKASAAVAVAPGPSAVPPAPPACAPPSRAAAPLAGSRPVARPVGTAKVGAAKAPAVQITSSRACEAGKGDVYGRDSEGGGSKREHVENAPCAGMSVPKPEQTIKSTTGKASVKPTEQGADDGTAITQVVLPKKAPVHTSAIAKAVSKVVPVSKPLGSANSMTASAPFKPPFSSSAGATSAPAGIKLSTTVVTYRVPGLRRPSGSGLNKNATQ